MSTDVATQKKSPLPAMANFAQGLSNVSTALKAGATGTPFLRMSKGEWLYGQENTEPAEGSLWAVDPLSIRHGWCSWRKESIAKKKGNKLLGEEMVSVSEVKAARSTLPDQTDGDEEDMPETHEWVEQMSVNLVCVESPEDPEEVGQDVLYKSSSRGFMNLMNEYIKELSKRINSGDPNIVVIVSLDIDSYVHRVHGKIHTPKWGYDDDSWRGIDDTSPVTNVETETETEAAEAAPDETEAEPPAEKTERRRRRRQA